MIFYLPSLQPLQENTQTPAHLQTKLAQHNQTVSSDEKVAEIVMANVLLNY